MCKGTPVQTEASFMASGGLVSRREAAGERVQVSAFILSVIVCALFSLAQVILDLRGAGEGARIEWEEKINPNAAPFASLMRLPGIGYSRAAAIVQYRENALDRDVSGPVFKTNEDLVKVRGLGPKTVESLSAWLEFGQ